MGSKIWVWSRMLRSQNWEKQAIFLPSYAWNQLHYLVEVSSLRESINLNVIVLLSV